MRRDRRLLERVDQDPAAEPVLRLFRFDPPGITVGHSQRVDRELDLERCRADGVPWAVRPTGGRAIFHAEEWTYSLSAGIADPEWGGSLADSYARAAHAILASLVRLGVPARMSSVRSREPSSGFDAGAPPRAEAAPPCFASTSRHEIVLEGGKLVGSAQRRKARGLLQQGSVLLGSGHERLVDYLRMTDGEREQARRDLARAAAPAGTLLDSRLGLDDWAAALLQVLPAGTRLHDAAAGAFRLTPAEADLYTPRAS